MSVVEMEFPVADIVWSEICGLHEVIEEYGLEEKWVTLMTPEIRDMSDFALVFSFLQLLSIYSRLPCRL